MATAADGREKPMTEQLPAEPPPSPESFGELYQLLAQSQIYRQITAEVFGEGYGGYNFRLPGRPMCACWRRGPRWPPASGSPISAAAWAAPRSCWPPNMAVRWSRVDWSCQALEICRRAAEAAELAHRLRYLAGDITRPLFADNSLHAVVSIDGFYFGVDLPWLYREVFRILRPGGRFAFYFNVPSQEVVDASSPERRAHRESHRIDHLAELSRRRLYQGPAGRTHLYEQQILSRMAAVYETHFEALASEVGRDLAADLRDEIVQTLHMTEHGQWPRYLFSARKPGDRPVRRR